MMAVTDRTECFKLVKRTQGVLLIILCVLHWGTARANHSCEISRQHFVGLGVPSSEILDRPVKGDVCGTNSCCSPLLESKLISKSRLQLDKFLKDSVYRLSSVLDTRAKRFDEFFRNLMTSSKREFHEMFKKTYGIIYLQHSFVFTDFFEELERYYNNGRVRLAEALDNFFVILYQRMFTVINSQYEFDERYLECVAEHMNELKPFGDVPHKLGVQLRRSFVATRAFYKALTIGSDVSKSMGALVATEKCGLELAQLQQCNKCLGLQGLKGCSTYCIGVLKSCLHHHISLDVQWNNYVDALDKVADRLLGSFNIEMVVEPINIKISEAVMIFQDNGVEVSQKIFTGCGNPVLKRRRREAGRNQSDIEEPRAEARRVKSSEDEITFESLNFNSDNNGKDKKKRKKVETVASLEKLIKDIKQKVKDSRQFWSQLPYQFCNNEAAPPSAGNNCWNGTAHPKPADQPRETTVVVVPGSPSPPTLNQQIFVLQALISKLQSAYQGQEVDLADDSDEMPVISGSGSGMDELEGSGDQYNFGGQETPRAETQPPPVPAAPPSSTHPPTVTRGGSSSISGPTLAKALAHYLLPIVLVWFGGAFSDLLL